MSLPSPLSVGDAFLLASIAYKVGKAFSSGAKSAPAEFAEVQSLLFSIGDALDLVGKNCTERAQQGAPEDTAAKLGGILKNCETFLKSLESFVDKYSVLDPSQVPNSGIKSASGRVWKREIIKNFKKVAWTTEGEGIVKLKQTLSAHVQALNLAMTAMNGGKQDATHQNVSDTLQNVQVMRAKLDEIHRWYEENLKRPPQSPGSPRHHTGPSYASRAFALYEERGSVGEAHVVVCPHAGLEDLWTNAGESELNAEMPPGNIFKCGCSSRAHSLQYTLLPFSVFVQMIGKLGGMQWQVYARSPASNTPVSLILQDIEPRHISQIEVWADQASWTSIATHLSGELQTSFVQTDEHNISVLRMKVNSMRYTGKLLNSVFHTINGAFTTGPFSSTQILQYATAGRADHDVKLTPTQLFPQAHVNVILNCSSQESQPRRCFTIRVYQDTNVLVEDRPRYIAMDSTACFQEVFHPGTESSSLSDPLECSKIMFEFSDAADAREFEADLQDAKHKLRMQYLQQVRGGDKLIGQLDIPGDHMIRNLILQDVQLKVILDQATKMFRMALLRRDHSACVTFELPPDFLQNLADGKESGYENYPAWFVDVGKDRISIVRQASGMDPLAALSKAFRVSNLRDNQIELEHMETD